MTNNDIYSVQDSLVEHFNGLNIKTENQFKLLVNKYCLYLKNSTEGLIFLFKLYVNSSTREQSIIHLSILNWLNTKSLPQRKVTLITFLQDLDLEFGTVNYLQQTEVLVVLKFIYSLLIKKNQDRASRDTPSEDPNKMLDIWYKKVKETNNFSCLYDDIDRAS